MVTAVTVVLTVAVRTIKVTLDRAVETEIVALMELVIPDFAVTVSKKAE